MNILVSHPSGYFAHRQLSESNRQGLIIEWCRWMTDFRTSKIKVLCDRSQYFNLDVIADGMLLQTMNRGDKPVTPANDMTPLIRDDQGNITVHCAIDIRVSFAYISIALTFLLDAYHF